VVGDGWRVVAGWWRVTFGSTVYSLRAQHAPKFPMPLELVLPDYLPARMLNEFVYCPRLFYYEWVEGVFAHNHESTEGALRHAKIDSRSDELVPADELTPDDHVHARSVTLSSDAHRLIAKIDLVEADGDHATPVEYKRGAPRTHAGTGELEAWPADRAQVAVQALILRDNGYNCDEAVIYYVKTKQRVRVAIDQALVSETLAALESARATAIKGEIPPPLVDSPKCPRCSLVGICLPDETRFVQTMEHERPASLTATADQDPAAADQPEAPRRLLAARDDLRPLYLNTQGLYVGKSGNVLKIKDQDAVVEQVRIGETCQVNVYGNIQLTTQAVHALCENEVPIAYFSMGGWFHGMTTGLGVRNIALRREQFRLADDPEFCLEIARCLVAGKIRNQRTMLRRNHIQPPAAALAQLKSLCDDAEHAASSEQLLGIEGNAARIYFENFSGMIKAGNARTAGEELAMELFEVFEQSIKPRLSGRDADALAQPPAPAGNGWRVAGGGWPDADAEAQPIVPEPAAESAKGSPATAREPEFNFDFTHRNRRPPRDPVNALLSLAYSVLAKDLTITCHAVGFDPFIGFFHQPRFGRAPLPLDLMEPFRPLIADSAVLSAINTRMVTPNDFIRAGRSVALKPAGRKAFFRAYEQRMDALVTHPIFGYRLNYRRMLEVQTRLLARTVTREIETYPVFVTR
jgi:CRISPR-associated protein Cas1